jgi:hypothetical protein
LRVDFQGLRIAFDGGLLLVRELDERLRLSTHIIENITVNGRGKNTQLPLPDPLRQSSCSRLARYEDVNCAEWLSQDPTLRLIGSEKIWERGAAVPSRFHEGLRRNNRELLAKAEAMDSPQLKLRPGNVRSAEDWGEVLLPEIERQQDLRKEWCLGPMLRLPNRRSTKRWKNGK